MSTNKGTFYPDLEATSSEGEVAQPLTVEELAAMTGSLGGLGLSSTAEATSQLEEMPVEANFLKRQFVLFSVPSMIVYIQGPKIGLSSSSSLAKWQDIFKYASCRRIGYRGIISEAASILLEQLPSSLLKLYNKNDANNYHRTLLNRLVEDGMDVKVGKTLSPTNVQATIHEYFDALVTWLKEQNKSYSQWEEEEKAKALDFTNLTTDQLADIWDSL